MHDTLKKTTLWHKKWAILLYNHPSSHSSGNIFVFPIPLLPPPTPPSTYLPTYPPPTTTLPFFCPPSFSIMLLPSLTSYDSHFTITKFPQHLLPSTCAMPIYASSFVCFLATNKQSTSSLLSFFWFCTFTWSSIRYAHCCLLFFLFCPLVFVRCGDGE